MAKSPRERLEHEEYKIRSLGDAGTIPEDCADALLELGAALDEDRVRHSYRNADGDERSYKPRTVERYLTSLRICCEAGLDLLDADADELNGLLARMHDDEGKSKSTLVGYSVAAQKFYRYFDCGVDPDDVITFEADSEPKHDELDMFTEEDVRALREACGETQWATRNRALLELLIFTGQRIRALITLRIKDVDVDNGYIYLNDEYEREHGGLKGALVRGRKRPIFGARKYVRDYIEYHRKDADPDDWLFVGNPSHWRTDPDDHWAAVSADHVLRRIGEAADVDKPVNPHNFRHYCATVLYRDYDVDRDTIRMLFGHTDTSSSLEETYSHLFDEDFIDKAEVALGYAEEKEVSTFTPDACPTCGEVLEDHWRQCPSCQEVFGPSEKFAEQLETTSELATEEGIASQDGKTIEAALAIAKAVDDPEALAEDLATLDS